MSKQNDSADTAALQSALNQTYWQIGICGFLVVVLGITLAIVYDYSDSVVNIDEEKLFSQTKNRINNNLDEIAEEVSVLGAELIPHIYDEMAEQVKKDSPKYLRLSKQELQVYQQNVTDALKKKLRTQFRQFLNRNRQLLAAKYPDYATDEGIERLWGKFEQAYARILDRYYVSRFRNQINHTEKLWNRFPPYEEVSSNDDVSRLFVEELESWVLAALEDSLPENQVKQSQATD